MMASGQDGERKALFVQKAGSNSIQRVRGPVLKGGEFPIRRSMQEETR